MELFVGIGVAWVIGMGGYVILNKMKRYNTVQFFDVSDRIRKYKKADERTSIKR